MRVSAYQSQHQRWTQHSLLLQPKVVQFWAEISPVLNLPGHDSTEVQKTNKRNPTKLQNLNRTTNKKKVPNTSLGNTGASILVNTPETNLTVSITRAENFILLRVEIEGHYS